MDDFFKIEEAEPVKMNKDEFVEKTKKLLLTIDKIYSSAWHSRPLKQEEFPDESVCDKCTGCGAFKEDGEDRDCFQDNEQGWCYHRFCDYEEVGIGLENHLKDMYDLLAVNEVI